MLRHMRLLIPISRNRRRGRHKKRRNWWQNLQEYVWPSIGLQGLLRWFEIAIKRSKGTAHSVALGVAFGTFISFTPTIGIQVLCMAIFCYVVRANFPAAILASLVVGNPWTFPFIWWWIYEFGHFILRMPPNILPDVFSFSQIINNFPYYWEEFLWPMTVGGFPSGLFAAMLAYWAVRAEVASYQKARRAFLKKRHGHLLKTLKTKLSTALQRDKDTDA